MSRYFCVSETRDIGFDGRPEKLERGNNRANPDRLAPGCPGEASIPESISLEPSLVQRDIEIDCACKKSPILGLIHCSEDGLVIKRESYEPTEWGSIIPDSVDDILCCAVCQQSKVSNKFRLPRISMTHEVWSISQGVNRGGTRATPF